MACTEDGIEGEDREEERERPCWANEEEAGEEKEEAAVAAAG